jgi:uncharacterized membrane protein YfcA
MQYFTAALIGLLSGITSGMFGVGGGIVMVPAMLFLLSPPIRDIKQAIGTSLVIMVPTAIIGAWRHYKPDAALTNIHWQTAWMVIPTALCGSFLGVWFTQYISADNLKRAFGGLLVVMGLKLVFFK